MTDSKIANKIKQARIAAMVCGTITLAGALTTLIKQTHSHVSLIHILSLIDVAFIFAMAYGIYRKSRMCAVFMFEYFLLSKIFNLSVSAQISAGVVIIGIVFLYFLLQGITGTFAYHKCRACRETSQYSNPLSWILAGSAGLILYVVVLPAMII